MSARGVGNPWTKYEDNLLIQAVAIHGENDNWKAVALSVPGRTNKACRKVGAIQSNYFMHAYARMCSDGFTLCPLA